ncbi:DNA-binding response regulator [Rickettsiales endosymbiont of Paramecium tredecaurelia]|nr:DNA-binding response regulator [Candidatus Sarmatiella mevalonica]
MQCILFDAGITTTVLVSGIEALNIIYSHHDYDIMILDLMLPDIDGYEVLAKMRSGDIQLPVLIVSALSSIEHKIKGLLIGADDYLTKPFHRDELVARIRAITRRGSRKNAIITFGDIMIDLEAGVVSVCQQYVRLGHKEYVILASLASNKHVILTKNFLFDTLYKGKPSTTSNTKIIDVYVCKLRKKLASVNGKDYIDTVWGFGYTLKENPTLPFQYRTLEDGRKEPISHLTPANNEIRMSPTSTKQEDIIFQCNDESEENTKVAENECDALDDDWSI